MPSADYYIVLGIPRDESPRGVRKAYVDLARRHHPDRAGPEGTPRFREVAEAYRVLSDPELRRVYDASLRREQREREVLRPSRRSPPPFSTRDPFARPAAVLPDAESLLDRILRNFRLAPVVKAERLEPLLCDVALDPEEARRGGVLPIRLPVLAPCPGCHGEGQVGGFACRRCDARGSMPTEVSIPLAIPAGVRSGTVLETSLESLGIHNLWLRARVGVRG